jgi:hypothetical protein
MGLICLNFSSSKIGTGGGVSAWMIVAPHHPQRKSVPRFDVIHGATGASIPKQPSFSSSFGIVASASIRMAASTSNADDDDNEQSSSSVSLQPIPADLEGVPIPFIDTVTNTFIECYADSTCTVQGITYTVAVPCDYSVALCTNSEHDPDQLVPIELSDPLMDDIFPVAEAIVNEEFGEELVLQRTPQTLTLVGELEEEDQDEETSQDDESNEEEEEEDEEVEVLLSFEHRDQEYHLVRIMDPILLVGKMDPDNSPEKRILLTPEESDQIMPILEEIFLEFHDDQDDDDDDDNDDDEELQP